MKKRLFFTMLIAIGFSLVGNVHTKAVDDLNNESIIEESSDSIDLYNHESNLLSLNDVSTNPSANMKRENDKIVLEIVNENGGLEIQAGNLETRTEYVLGFTYKKLEGELKSFGGHTDGVWMNNQVKVDGKNDMSEFQEIDSAFVKDDEEEHVVEIRFTTPRDASPESSIFIQPNRGDFEFVTVELSNMYIIEAELIDETS